MFAARNMMFAGGDPDLAAFVTASGATDTTAIAALVAYLKAESLWTSSRFFPFKSAQNKGSGSTVYGLGGWTSNPVNLVNGPTWGATGVTFDATNDRATWDATGIASLSDLTVFDVQIPAAASLADTARFGIWSVGSTATAAQRFFAGAGTASALSGETISIALNALAADPRRVGASDITWSAGSKTQIITRLAASGFGIWKDKTAASLSLTSGTQNFAPSQSGFATDSTMNLNVLWDSSGPSYSFFVSTTRVALLACKTSLTTLQRETITDLLNAL